jgi:hypothetical protein
MTIGLMLLVLMQAPGEVTLSGRVMDSVTHQPVIGARVQYQSLETVSDDKGAWSLNVKPFISNRQMIISKKGYTESRLYFTVKSAAGETHDFEVSPAAHLSGRIVDRDSGKPVAGMMATARGKGGVFYAEASGYDGSFFIQEDLLPGSYVLEFHPSSGVTFETGEAKPEQPGYGQTWYPGAPRADMAAPVTLLAGEHRDIEMRLQKRELHRIAATVGVPEGREDEPIQITLSMPGRGAVLVHEIAKAGAFRIGGLDDGSYELEAQIAPEHWPPFTVMPASRRIFAIATIEIRGHDVEDLKLPMRPGVSIRAVISMAEKDGKVPGKTSLALNAMPSSAAHMQGAVKAHLRNDPLRAEGLPVGEYWPRLYVPSGYYVVSSVYNGSTVFHTSIDIEAPESTVEFVITSRAATLTGVVRDSDGDPVEGAVIALLPQPLPAVMEKFDPNALLTVESDGNGRFGFTGLAPGEYKAVALTGEDRQRAHDLQFLHDRMQSSESIALDFSQTSNVELRLK